MSRRFIACVLLPLLSLIGAPAALLAQDFIPRRQSKPPGPPLSPAEAIAKMTVPEGFHVELVASEPDLRNPVAMAFDDRGRIYVNESFEYPRHEPGPGRDRIKILEDTNGDGRADSVKIFAEGLNIPSGIAVGFGGVWVANAPDILFLEDTDGDDRADKTTVVATGFGRDDTHELPNALTWGPDGFLYGLNGVFNRSVVTQGETTFDFTCAMFRIDPVTHRFDLFCEGTSNPWGITFDDEGSAFVSACVIDHLWHLTESGYYHRQGGPYPPHTWKIESIVDHQHQMAAYCGIEYFDSPAYPAEYRKRLYMGNIHGGCINVDSVERSGSTYKGHPHPDFLTANDVWFMPVAQKVGPDGCLYILDWYDRYHCYQDASADPTGVDRGHGRLYRVVHDQRPEVRYPDLTTLDSQQLVDLLADENIFYRQRASVVLASRLRTDPESPSNRTAFQTMLSRVLDTANREDSGATPPLYLLTTLVNAPQMDAVTMGSILESSDPLTLSWAVRAAATRNVLSPAILERIAQFASHPDPRVRLQVAIAAGKVGGAQGTRWLLTVLDHSTDDGLLPRIVWGNLEPRVPRDHELIVERLAHTTTERGPSLLGEMAPRIASRMLADLHPDLTGTTDTQSLLSVLRIADSLARTESASAAANPTGSDQSGQVLQSVVDKLRTGEIRPQAAQEVLADWLADSNTSGLTTLQIRCFAGDADAAAAATDAMLDQRRPLDERLSLLGTLAALADTPLEHAMETALEQALDQWIVMTAEDREIDQRWRDALLGTIIERGDRELRSRLVARMPSLPTGVQATVAERMTQREPTALMLLEEIAQDRLRKDLVGPNQIRLLAAHPSAAVQSATREIWGTIRLEDSHQRQQVIRELSEFLLGDARGDARRGLVVYDRICGQCHQLNGRGYEVGPDITRNGRGSFEQLIVSVFDPSLVIGDAYKSVTVLTDDGRVINGIVLEQSPQRLVLKIQGGKQEIIPAETIEEMRQNPQSLMPEGLEQQMTREELADLFALLSLEHPVDAEENATIPGTPAGLHTGR